jgi:hypothetical protein
MKKEWRCKCGKLLGIFEGGRLHIRFARGYQYMVGFPVSTVCRDCGTLNELEEGGVAKAAQ